MIKRYKWLHLYDLYSQKKTKRLFMAQMFCKTISKCCVIETCFISQSCSDFDSLTSYRRIELTCSPPLYVFTLSKAVHPDIQAARARHMLLDGDNNIYSYITANSYHFFKAIKSDLLSTLIYVEQCISVGSQLANGKVLLKSPTVQPKEFS